MEWKITQEELEDIDMWGLNEDDVLVGVGVA